MWKYFVHFILYLYCVHGIEDANLIYQDDSGTNKFNSITECIIILSDMELYFRPTVAILAINANGSEENAFIYDLINKLTEYNIPKVLLNDIINEDNHDLHRSSLTVAFFDTCADVINFNFKSIDKEMKFLIIISDPSCDDCAEKLREIGEIVSNYDITFIVQDVLTDYNKMYTLFPQINENTCKESVDEPSHINTCLNGSLQKSKQVFPIKNPVNLNKCPFKVGMATLYPFSTIKDKELLITYDHIEDVKGSDLEIMKIVTEYFNASLDLYYIFRKEENPYTDMEFIKLLLNGTLDACAGGLYRIYGDIVDYSGPYASQNVFWMYSAKRADRSWENLIRKMNDVYVFVIFYICYSFVWYFISLYDGEAVSLVATLVYGWGALVGATSLQDARSSKQKVLNLMYLIMCIYLSAYISMQLYLFLTIRAPPQMLKSNDDVMQSGRIPYLKTSTKYFITDEKYVEYANTSEDCVSFLDCAEKTLLYNGLTIILQGNFFKYQAATAVNDEARVLRTTENMLTVYNEMMIRKNSSLVRRFQKVVQRLFEAGITRRLFVEAVGISVVAKAESANANMIASSYSCQAGCSITFKQLAGVFYVWIFGCVLSCIVFAIEVYSKLQIKPITNNNNK